MQNGRTADVWEFFKNGLPLHPTRPDGDVNVRVNEVKFCRVVNMNERPLASFRFCAQSVRFVWCQYFPNEQNEQTSDGVTNPVAPQRPPPFNLLNQFGTNFWPGTLTILEHIVAVTLGSWLMNIFWNISFFGTSSAPFLSVCSTTLELLGEKRRFRPSFKLITGRLLVNNGRFHALIMTTHQTVSAHRCPQKSHGTFTF